MGYLKICIITIGLVVGSEVLYAVVRKLFVKKQQINTVLVFSDTCPSCAQPNNKLAKQQPCCSRNVNILKRLLDNTRTSLDLCLLLLTCPVLLKAIQRAHARGVSVRIITDYEMASASNSAMIDLHFAGIPIRCKPSVSMMHCKFCVVDGSCDTGGLLVHGSANWTTQAWRGNWENVAVTGQLALVTAAHRAFLHLWASLPALVLPEPPQL